MSSRRSATVRSVKVVTEPDQPDGANAPADADAGLAPGAVEAAGIDPVYAETTRLCERLHRRYLDVVRIELTRAGDDAITPAQALMLLDIGNGELEMRDLVDRGYYLATTATYNVRKLAECGYLEQTRAQRDRRMSRIKLTKRGQVLRDRLESLDAERCRAFLARPGMSEQLAAAASVLRELELSFFDRMSFRRP